MTWSEDETASSIPERFREQVRRAPDGVAIAGIGEPLTYSQLDQRSDCYAEALPELADAPDGKDAPVAPAALLLDHGAPVIAGALAALKSRYVVVVLNPTDPPARHAQIRAAIEPAVLLTAPPRLRQARAAGFGKSKTFLCSDSIDGCAGRQQRQAAPDDLAFLLATSGSTGRPKMVMQTHRNVLHNVLRYVNGLGIRPDDRIAWLASLSGGQGLATAWTALLNGATLCPFAFMDRGVTGLAAWLVEHRVTVFDTLPSLLRNFSQALGAERVAGVRLVRLASEAGLRSDFEAFRLHFPAGSVLASVLASSETGIISQALLGPDRDPSDGRLTVGTDAPGIELALVDERGREVPTGESGEIVVASRYLSPGYWRDEQLTSQRFSVRGGVRQFHSGDLARRSAAGDLVVVGRRDSQVKVRGHRLQLEEIEVALAAQPGVSAAALKVSATPRGDARLIAYVASASGSPLDRAGLREALSATLPAYAIPAAFVPIDQLPMTPHGKIDRSQLPEWDGTTGASKEVTVTPIGAKRQPSSETEELLADLWRQALENDMVGLDDPFLELGGDSLTAAVIAAGVYEAFGVELELAAFAGQVTVAQMAELVEQSATDSEASLPRLRARPAPPASLVQQVMWRIAQLRPDALMMGAAYRIVGPLDLRALQHSVDQLVRRHDILRTTFVERDGRIVQCVGAPKPVDVPIVDLRRAPDPAGRAAELLSAEARRPFDLARGPLMRLQLARLQDEEHQLLRVNHHLIADALSWTILFEELAVLYEARVTGLAKPLTQAPALQYADYALWQWECMSADKRPRYQAELDWWQRALDPLPPDLSLPFSRPSLAGEQSDAGRVMHWGLSSGPAQALDRIGRDTGATYFMTRLAVFSAMLALETGVDDLLVETFVTTRRRAELQRMIGPLINRALLRLRFQNAPTLRGWLAAVRRTVIETSANTTIPEQRLRVELGRRGIDLPAPAAKFEALYRLPKMRFGGLEVEPAGPEPVSRPHSFVIGVDRLYDASRCRAVFDPRIDDPALVARFIRRMQELVVAACADPDAPLPDLHRSLPGEIDR